MRGWESTAEAQRRREPQPDRPETPSQSESLPIARQGRFLNGFEQAGGGVRSNSSSPSAALRLCGEFGPGNQPQRRRDAENHNQIGPKPHLKASPFLSLAKAAS